MFLYDFAKKTAQKPDTVAAYIRRNEKIFKNHVERREKQLWLDEKAELCRSGKSNFGIIKLSVLSRVKTSIGDALDSPQNRF